MEDERSEEQDHHRREDGFAGQESLSEAPVGKTAAPAGDFAAQAGESAALDDESAAQADEPAAEPASIEEPGADRVAEPEDTHESIDPKTVIEALLFSAPSPVKVGRLAAAADLETKEVESLIQALNEDYARENRAFHIIPVAKGYQMMSKSAYFPYIQKLTKARARDKLTGAALETLAIIAYKQPIIRADVEAIRGVQSGQIIRNLLEARLIRVTGRDARLGHPMLYGTTKRFLEVFGLKSLKELPSLEELKAF